jgi:Flp pilus assembly protein TadG
LITFFIFFGSVVMVFKSLHHSLNRQFDAFVQDRSGAVAYLTAILALIMVGLIGLAVDYGSAVVQKGKLDAAAQAAATSGANAARNLLQLNMTQNSQFDAVALAEGQRVANEAFDGQLGLPSQLSVGTKYVTLARVGNTISAQIDYDAVYTTVFSQLFGVSGMDIKGTASIIVGMLDNPPSSKLLEEVWDQANAPAAMRTIVDPVYRDWTIQDGMPRVGPTGDSRAGRMALGIGSGYNNSIAKKVYMPAGYYELRYWYKSSVVYPEYDPAFICDATAPSGVDWAVSGRYTEYTGSTIRNGSPQSARIGVYMHPVKQDPRLAIAPPITSQLTNRIDTCAYAGRWIQRSIGLHVTDSGYFWLAFAGDAPGASDKRGAWIGQVKLCIASCGEPAVNNYPYARGAIIMNETFNSPLVANGTPFSLATSPIPAAALYKQSPANLFEVVSNPPEITVSNNAPVDDGQHIVFRKSQSLYRRVLLTPGIYAMNFKVRGDNRSSACPIVRMDRNMIFGVGPGCSGAGIPGSVWVDRTWCISVYSTHFVKVGVQVWINRTNGEMRFDSFRLLAGDNYARFPDGNIPGFCSGTAPAFMFGEENVSGAMVMLDRVNVQPPIYQ